MQRIRLIRNREKACYFLICFQQKFSTCRTKARNDRVTYGILISMDKQNYFEHHFLIAMPSLNDPNFSRAVVYLFEHSAQGALGMIINKPQLIRLGEVMHHLNIADINPAIAELPVYAGGPVAQEHGFIVHSKKNDSAIDVSASKEILEKIAHNEGPDEFLITLGYSGWSAGQLDNEISRNDWLVAPPDKTILFNTDVEQRWQKAAALIGVDVAKLSGQVGHA